MPEVKLPESCTTHANKYKNNAWQDYSIQELGMWVHLFCKRAEHRADATKRTKDIEDAQNYLNMIQAHINNIKG